VIETPSDPEPEAGPIVVGLVPAPHVDLGRILADSHAIDSLGARTVGSPAERKAAEYVAERLREMGYEPVVEEFPVPGGTSRNVIARAKGAVSRVIVLGAHLDSKKGSPGANDDAVGCAILLEAARLLAARPAFPAVELVFFGSEEYNDGKPKDHHRGSRFRVKSMSAEERAKTAGMISVDVIGYGTTFHVRTMGVGPPTMSDYLLAEADRLDVKLTYLKDPGPTGWSDHEPYEKAGIPAAWLERLSDPAYHKAGDVTAHLQREKVREAAQFTLDALYDMGAGELAMLRP
jgi:Iap family predicted aminopeptidase